MEGGEAYLPSEILMEILSRLDVKSLLILKCVSKLWYNIIEDQHLIQMHLSRAEGTYVLTDSLYEDGDNKDFCLLELNGLLVDIRWTTDKFRLRNPATKTKIDLPDPLRKPEFASMMHLPSSDTYKVISLFDKEGDRFGGCQVLTLGTDQQWRILEIPSLRHLNCRQLASICTIGNMAYICLSDAAAKTTVRDIVCIELEAEVFETVTAPEALFASWDSVMPLSWEDKLSLYKTVGQELHVWVLEDFKNRKWAEKEIVISLSFLSKRADISDIFHLRYVVIEGLLYIQANGITRICYKIKSGRIFDVPDMGVNMVHMRFTLVNPYRVPRMPPFLTQPTHDVPDSKSLCLPFVEIIEFMGRLCFPLKKR